MKQIKDAYVGNIYNGLLTKVDCFYNDGANITIYNDQLYKCGFGPIFICNVYWQHHQSTSIENLLGELSDGALDKNIM